MLKKLFSLGNEYEDTPNGGREKFKVVWLLGVKFRFQTKRRFKQKAQREYFEYLQSPNVDKSAFVPLTDKPYNNENSVKPIAFYLPQFHAIELNDEHFGKGFTEWSNVAKAIPQFVGHHQPQLPYDVGFYDLSTDAIMHRQIELAKLYGIYGFCFYYYWFSGKRLLEKPIFNYLANKKLDLPFCLCWANENWSKLWDGGDREVIMHQDSENLDANAFFADILPFLKDKRYIKIDTKPVLLIYRMNFYAKELMLNFIKNLRNLAAKMGGGGFNDLFIIGAKSFGFEEQLDYGADAVVEFPPHLIDTFGKSANISYANTHLKGNVIQIDDYILGNSYTKTPDPKLFKTAFPSWDNTARKAMSGCTVFKFSIDLGPRHFKQIMNNTFQ